MRVPIRRAGWFKGERILGLGLGLGLLEGGGGGCNGRWDWVFWCDFEELRENVAVRG